MKLILAEASPLDIRYLPAQSRYPQERLPGQADHVAMIFLTWMKALLMASVSQPLMMPIMELPPVMVAASVMNAGRD